MKPKMILTTVLATLLACALFAGCGQPAPGSAPSSSESTPPQSTPISQADPPPEPEPEPIAPADALAYEPNITPPELPATWTMSTEKKNIFDGYDYASPFVNGYAYATKGLDAGYISEEDGSFTKTYSYASEEQRTEAFRALSKAADNANFGLGVGFLPDVDGFFNAMSKCFGMGKNGLVPILDSASGLWGYGKMDGAITVQPKYKMPLALVESYNLSYESAIVVDADGNELPQSIPEGARAFQNAFDGETGIYYLSNSGKGSLCNVWGEELYNLDSAETVKIDSILSVGEQIILLNQSLILDYSGNVIHEKPQNSTLNYIGIYGDNDYIIAVDTARNILVVLDHEGNAVSEGFSNITTNDFGPWGVVGKFASNEAYQLYALDGSVIDASINPLYFDRKQRDESIPLLIVYDNNGNEYLRASDWAFHDKVDSVAGGYIYFFPDLAKAYNGMPEEDRLAYEDMDKMMRVEVYQFIPQYTE